MRKVLAIITLAVFCLAFADVSAGEHEHKGKAEHKGMGEHQKKAEHKTLSGTLVCMGCELKSGDGARAACKEFGHKHVLQTNDGSMVGLLENKYSRDLMGEKYHGQKMEIHGIHYANANVVDVESFAVNGSKKTWCNHCTAMDGCASK